MIRDLSKQGSGKKSHGHSHGHSHSHTHSHSHGSSQKKKNNAWTGEHDQDDSVSDFPLHCDDLTFRELEFRLVGDIHLMSIKWCNRCNRDTSSFHLCEQHVLCLPCNLWIKASYDAILLFFCAILLLNRWQPTEICCHESGCLMLLCNTVPRKMPRNAEYAVCQNQ